MRRHAKGVRMPKRCACGGGGALRRRVEGAVRLVAIAELPLQRAEAGAPLRHPPVLRVGQLRLQAQLHRQRLLGLLDLLLCVPTEERGGARAHSCMSERAPPGRERRGWRGCEGGGAETLAYAPKAARRASASPRQCRRAPGPVGSGRRAARGAARPRPRRACPAPAAAARGCSRQSP